MAQSTKNASVITACLTLLSTNIPRLIKLKLNINQVKEVLRLLSIKGIGGEHQLRLVTNWIDSEEATTAHINPVDQFYSVLPFVDLQSITETALLSFMCEDHAILRNQQCRLFPSFSLP